MRLSSRALAKLADFGLSMGQILEFATLTEEDDLSASSAASGGSNLSPKAAANARYYQRQKLKLRSKTTESVTENHLNSDTELSENILIQSSLARVSDLTSKLEITGKEERVVVSVAETSRAKRGCRLPPNWRPDASLKAFAQDQGFLPTQVEDEIDRFRDYWNGIAGSKGAKLDWDGTFRNWIRNSRNPRGALGTQQTLTPMDGNHGQRIDIPTAKQLAREDNLQRGFAAFDVAASRVRSGESF